MNPDQSRLRHEEQTETEKETSSVEQKAEEFATVEDLLRHDCAQNAVPPAIAARLNESLALEPQQPRSWLKKLFG